MRASGGQQLKTSKPPAHVHHGLPEYRQSPGWYTSSCWRITLFHLVRFFANKMEKKHFSKIQFFIESTAMTSTPVTPSWLRQRFNRGGRTVRKKTIPQIAHRTRKSFIQQSRNYSRLPESRHNTSHFRLPFDLKSYLRKNCLTSSPLRKQNRPDGIIRCPKKAPVSLLDG